MSSFSQLELVFLSLLMERKESRIDQLIEIEKKLKNRHYEIHYYENSINVYQHVCKKRYRLIV